MTNSQINILKEEITPERLYAAFIKACEENTVCVEDGPIHAHRGLTMIRIDIREV